MTYSKQYQVETKLGIPYATFPFKIQAGFKQILYVPFKIDSNVESNVL